MYPPHSIALGSIYIASLLLSFEQPPVPLREGETSSADLASMLNQHTEWEDKYKTKAQDLDGAFLLSLGDYIPMNILSKILHTHFSTSSLLTPNHPRRLLQTPRLPRHLLPPLISLETGNITSTFPTIPSPNPS